jgi:hypothetical protein
MSMMLNVGFTETNILSKFYQNLFFPYQVFPIKFPLLKLIFFVGLHCVYVGPIFLGLG